MKDRVTFRRNTPVSDDMGGSDDAWADLATVWGQFKPKRGKEVVIGDQTTAMGGGILWVRHSSTTAGLTEKDIVVIDSVEYDIKYIEQPDRRNKTIELVIERGGVVS